LCRGPLEEAILRGIDSAAKEEDMEHRRVLFAVAGPLSLAIPSMLGCHAPPDPTAWGVEASPASLGTGQPPGPRTAAPPISGGTLLVMQDGNTAVAADPDRDRVWIVDLAGRSLLHEVVLQPGDEPGRVIEDGSGQIHVALRTGGAVVSIDPLTGSITRRRPVCPAPRGLAYDSGVIHVACADGRLVTFTPDGDAAYVIQLDRDLRDVVPLNGMLYVSLFRSAELLEIAPGGAVTQRIALPSFSDGPTTATPAVAWRAVAAPGGGIAILHQRGQQEPVSTQPGGYAGGGKGCEEEGLEEGIVTPVVTLVTPGSAPPATPPIGMSALSVDLAFSADGNFAALATSGFVQENGGFPAAYVLNPTGVGCNNFDTSGPVPMVQHVTAVAFDGNDHAVFQVREPPAIFVDQNAIPLPGESAADEGHTIFHTATLEGIACASCHPEGGDDGRVWQFIGLGPRRTQNIRGGVLARVPFHWSGDIPDMDALVTDVLVGRMGGNPLSEPQTQALGAWMNAQPALAPPPPADPASVARGAQLFAEPSLGCTTCHSGPQMSTHQLVDVGTGGTFKVPSLIAVGYRAPYMHDGCAASLQDRFDPTCGGGDSHGVTGQLDAGQIDDLVAYLESL
jgi:hypothetical protein